MSEPAERVESNPDTAYEASDWPVAAIALALGAVLVVLAIAVLVLRLGFSSTASDVDRSRRPMPEPRLQTDPAADLARLRAREERELNSYYWIDRDKGIVHSPVEEAIKQVLARGLDGFPQAPR